MISVFMVHSRRKPARPPRACRTSRPCPATRWSPTAKASTASALTTNGGSASSGPRVRTGRSTSRSPTITEGRNIWHTSDREVMAGPTTTPTTVFASCAHVARLAGGENAGSARAEQSVGTTPLLLAFGPAHLHHPRGAAVADAPRSRWTAHRRAAAPERSGPRHYRSDRSSRRPARS